jgi:VanZ family protein
MTGNRSLVFARLAFAALCLSAAPLMLAKQFQGLEAVVGLNDKAAHAIAFYTLSLALFGVAPRARRQDLCLFVLATALAVELLQHFTGRSMSVGDFLAGAAGVVAAWAPGKIEELRCLLRGEKDQRAAPRAISETRSTVGAANLARFDGLPLC